MLIASKLPFLVKLPLRRLSSVVDLPAIGFAEGNAGGAAVLSQHYLAKFAKIWLRSAGSRKF